MIELKKRSITVLTDDEVKLVSGGRSSDLSFICWSENCGSFICWSDGCDQSFVCYSDGCDSYACASDGCFSYGCASEGVCDP